MHPAVEAALKDWRIMNESGYWWARLDMQWPEHLNEPIVMLEYGIIHHNGFVECRLGSKSYYVNQDGSIGVV